MEDLMTKLYLPFPDSLTEAIFIERPNRFVVQCKLSQSGETVLAHLPDPGRLKELLRKGRKIWLLHNDSPHRKTKWTAVLTETESGNGFVSINTTYPNQLVEKGLRDGVFSEWKGWLYKKSEFSLGNSRWDFLLENSQGRQMLLEVKSVTLVKDRQGMFPDAVTKRGTKHVKELIDIAKTGEYETGVLFIVQRDDVDSVTAASHIDPAFAQTLREAALNKVSLHARTCEITLSGIYLGRQIPVVTEIK